MLVWARRGTKHPCLATDFTVPLPLRSQHRPCLHAEGVCTCVGFTPRGRGGQERCLYSVGEL